MNTLSLSLPAHLFPPFIFAQLWDLRTGRLLQNYEAHADTVNEVSFDPSGELLYSASSDATVKIWDLREGHQLYTIHSHKGGVLSVNVEAGASRFATCGADKQVMVWASHQAKAAAHSNADNVDCHTACKLQVPEDYAEEKQQSPMPEIPLPKPVPQPERRETQRRDDLEEKKTSAMQTIVEQLDVISQTLGVFDQRLTSLENR